MMNAINPVQRVGPKSADVTAIGEVKASKPASAAAGLTFSKHLNERINRRNLDMSPEKLVRLSEAVDRASDKGARDSVVLLDNLALLVNVPSRTVVTAMETEKMKHGVFTNIDAVVVG
jgi:flagellar operon protein